MGVEGADPTAVSGVTAVGTDKAAEQSSGFGTDTAEYHERRGSSFFDGGQYTEAEDSYREAIKLDPGHARFFHNLGTALFAQNRYDRAESAEREAVRLAPGGDRLADHRGHRAFHPPCVPHLNSMQLSARQWNTLPF